MQIENECVPVCFCLHIFLFQVSEMSQKIVIPGILQFVTEKAKSFWNWFNNVSGERLFKVGPENVSGHGTYVTHNYIYSSLAGFLNLVPSEKDPNVNLNDSILVKKKSISL